MVEEKDIETMVSTMFQSMIRNGQDKFTVRQIAIFFAIAHEPLHITQLSSKLGIPMPSVSKCCDALEARGLIQREDTDLPKTIGSYRKKLRITPAGDASVGKIISSITRALL